MLGIFQNVLKNRACSEQNFVTLPFLILIILISFFCRVPSEGGTGGEAENGEEEKETDRAFEVGSRIFLIVDPDTYREPNLCGSGS
jgi:hypothetical protein